MPEVLPVVHPFVIVLMLALPASVVGAWIWVALRLAFGASVVPRFEPRIVPWGGKSALAVILVWLAVQVGVQKLYRVATQGTIPDPDGGKIAFNPAEMMTASAFQNLTVLVVVPLVLWLTARARPRDLGLVSRRAGWQILQGIVAWPLAAPVVYGMMFVAVAIWGRESHPLETAIQTDGVGGKAVIFFLAGAVLAPAAEELIFRGVLLGWLTRLVLTPRAAAQPVPATLMESDLPESEAPLLPPDGTIVTEQASVPEPTAPWRETPGLVVRLAVANVAVSLLFAALHHTVWPTPVPIFFLSLALGLLYQRTGSLLAPVALHMTFNTVSTVLMFLLLGTHPQGEPAGTPPAPIPAPIPRPVDPITKPPVAAWTTLSKNPRSAIDARGTVGYILDPSSKQRQEFPVP